MAHFYRLSLPNNCWGSRLRQKVEGTLLVSVRSFPLIWPELFYLKKLRFEAESVGLAISWSSADRLLYLNSSCPKPAFSKNYNFNLINEIFLTYFLCRSKSSCQSYKRDCTKLAYWALVTNAILRRSNLFWSRKLPFWWSNQSSTR